MTAHPHPFIAAAAALFDEPDMPYQLTDESMTVELGLPLRHVLIFSAKQDRVVLDAQLDAKIIEGNGSDALLLANILPIKIHFLQSYILPVSDRVGLVPYAKVALPAFVFDETHATKTVALFVGVMMQWVEWWAEHADLLELSPREG